MLKFVLLFVMVFLEAKEYKSKGEWTSDSKKSACDRALSFAKDNAMAQAGTFVSSSFSIDFSDNNGNINNKKSRELKQYSLGFTKLVDKKEKIIINKKTYQFTCKVNAIFDIDTEKIKNFFAKQNRSSVPKISSNKNIDLEFYKLSQKIDLQATRIKDLQKQLQKKQDDTKKISILHGLIGVDSAYGKVSGIDLTFGLVLKNDFVFKFGSGANKALLNQNYNTLEIMDYSLTDNNSLYSYFYHILGVEYYAFRYKEYFLVMSANIESYDSDTVRINKTVAKNISNKPSDISGSFGLYLGFSYYRFGLIFAPSFKTTYADSNVYQTSPLKFGLSLAIPIDIY